MDLMINKNGNFLINSINGSFAYATGISYYRQLIYISLMEMDPTIITSKRFNSIEETISNLRSYLDFVIGLELPFPVQSLKISGTRNTDESISLQIELPTIKLAEEGNEFIDLRFQLREGIYQQLDYNFTPDLTKFPKSKIRITEYMRLNDIKSRVKLKHEYSGKGIIRFYNINDEEKMFSSKLKIVKRDDYLEYNLLDFLPDPDLLIDNVFITKGKEFLEKFNDKEVIFKDGMPFIYFLETAENGSTVEISFSSSNCVAFSNSVELIKNDSEMKVFSMKSNDFFYVATLSSPIGPGEYKAKYWANIYYDGTYV